VWHEVNLVDNLAGVGEWLASQIWFEMSQWFSAVLG
jgi:hypothetical protein